MYYWRVTKYNPQYRDEKGRYLIDEWTSYSDIGKAFSGKILTTNMYIEVENSYIDVVISAMKEMGLKSFKIIGLEWGQYDEMSRGQNEAYKVLSGKLREGCNISIDEVRMALCLILREEIWAKLISDNLFIHFGYDYYMYIGSQERLILTRRIAQKHRLFMEKMKFPHLG